MGPYLVDEKNLGSFSETTEGIIIDNVLDRDRQKIRVKVLRTEKVSLWTGLSTVAVFRIKKAPPVGATPGIFENFLGLENLTTTQI